MRVFSLFFLLSFLLSVSAQESSQSGKKLAEEVNKQFDTIIGSHVIGEVGQFTQYLQDIADKKLPIMDRYKYKDIALTLFIGGGKEYSEDILDIDGKKIDEVRKPAVTMEVTSLRRKTKTKREMAKYLQGLADIKYREVTIQTTKWHDMRVSEIRKTDDGKYECVVYFDQIVMCKGHDNIPGHTDRTKKRINSYIDIVSTDDGIDILVLLGDVQATESTRV